MADLIILRTPFEAFNMRWEPLKYSLMFDFGLFEAKGDLRGSDGRRQPTGNISNEFATWHETLEDAIAEAHKVAAHQPPEESA